MPDEEGKYLETPTTLTAQLEKFADHGWLNLVGGCCGTTEKHIRAIAHMVENKKPRQQPAETHRAVYSGIEAIEAEESTRPPLVGERTNLIGSRLFKNLVAEEKWEEAREIARRQVRGGAHIVDVCLQSTERDEKKDIPTFYERLIRKVKAPVMIDTTDPTAIELVLMYCQGKAILNSINLEDGEEKFERVVPIAHEFGAAVVVGCIDEDKLQVQAFTRERKLEIAQRSYKLLTENYGLGPEDYRRCGRDHRRHTFDQAGAAGHSNDPGYFECFLWATGWSTRSGQLGIPVLLQEGGAGPRDRQHREAGAVRVNPCS
jgi:5-methyltetrahydrofolate--homocysteine methyltransferase